MGETAGGERQRETGRMANIEPHQTAQPISERWMREAADCNSSPAALQISLSLLHLSLHASHSFSGSQLLFFSSLTVSNALSASPPVILFPFPALFSFCLLFFLFSYRILLLPPAHLLFLSVDLSSLPFSFSPPCTFIISIKHLYQTKKALIKGFSLHFSHFCSLLPSFTCKNNCYNNLSNSIIKIFLSVAALSLYPSPPSFIITIQSHQITTHVFYVKP